MVPCFTRFDEYLKKFGKKDVLDVTKTPHSWANNAVGKNFWEVISTDPKRVEAFDRGLSIFESLHPIMGMYPFDTELKTGNSADRPLMVDVGGGRGLSLLQVRNGCPDLKGKMVLEDRPDVVDSIPEEELPNVEKIGHDFFTEQPVKGADFPLLSIASFSTQSRILNMILLHFLSRHLYAPLTSFPGAQIYYFRRVFHDWTDHDARRILSNIKPAMAPDSRILISEMCIPEPITMADTNAVWLDLMMLSIGGKERTEKDWYGLVENVGLRVVKVWRTPYTGPLVVVEVALKEGETGSKAATNGA